MDRIADTIEAVVTLSRAINENLLVREAPGMQIWPSGPGAAGNARSTEANACWRGGGFRDIAAIRAFYAPGKRYRVDQFLATSFDRGVAHRFIARVRLVRSSCLQCPLQWLQRVFAGPAR